MLEKTDKMIEALSTVLIGKKAKIKRIVSAILTGGNILLEDMPGVGKTILSKSLSRIIYSKQEARRVQFSRIQGTPDLLPYDITGVDVYDPNSNDFTFKKGPVFTEILLADELNRTTPKVQSALLQCMAEKQVTVGNKTYELPEIFFVIATQNPVESEGTYPLPAAQLDRFTCCLSLGYPDIVHEIEILKKGRSEERFNDLPQVISVEEILELRKMIRKIEVSEKIIAVIAKISHKTRENRDIKLGLSTRANLLMMDMLRANAFLDGRNYVTDQDLIDLTEDVWAHRLIILNPQIKSRDLINRITRDELRKTVSIR